MGEYVSGKSNGYSGGIYNSINLNLYHYANNNPLKYVDPDGRESGYILDEDGAGGMGHAGIFVKTEKGYSFFEVNNLSDEKKFGDKADDWENSEILSNSKLRQPTPRTANLLGRATSAGVIRRDFKDRTEMMAYLGTDKNVDDAFERVLEFATTPEQDKIIYANATKMGQNFSGYALIGNSCGTWARDVLTSSGTGINKINLNEYMHRNCLGSILQFLLPDFYIHKQMYVENAPKEIFNTLSYFNKNSESYRIRK